MLAELLRPIAANLATHFEHVPVPAALGTGGMANLASAEVPVADLVDASASVVVLAGPYALRNPAGLHALADHLGTPVANTWGAKGIYPWDDPHHMGTCGLQRDDFELLGFADFDLVLAVGVDQAETPSYRYGRAKVAFAEPDQLDILRVETSSRPLRAADNELYRRIAAVAQPGYVDDAFPRHPARAVMDLKQSLGPSMRVTAQPGPAGLWIARTFPTDRMGSVIVPAYDRPGIGAAVGLISAAQGTETVCVVAGPIDDVTDEVLDVARHHELRLRVEVWEDVNWDRTEELIAAAGPVVAWT